MIESFEDFISEISSMTDTVEIVDIKNFGTCAVFVTDYPYEQGMPFLCYEYLNRVKAGCSLGYGNIVIPNLSVEDVFLCRMVCAALMIYEDQVTAGKPMFGQVNIYVLEMNFDDFE